jgi:hypothetical protein
VTGRRLAGRLLLGLLVVGLTVLVVGLVSRAAPPPVPPLTGDPPVLAGRHLWQSCSAGVYARRGDTIVLTSSGHCAAEGDVATDPDGTIVRGVFGPAARSATCDRPGKTCAASDMNYLVVADDRIPWGRLNTLDMGTGGVRTVDAGVRPPACDEVPLGARVEINGRDRYREGVVLEIGANDFPEDGMAFPCMVVADIGVDVGDSGGVVLLRGAPWGVASRSFGGRLGFTPLAGGLEELGLELCTSPDCGLTPPAASP